MEGTAYNHKKKTKQKRYWKNFIGIQTYINFSKEKSCETYKLQVPWSAYN